MKFNRLSLLSVAAIALLAGCGKSSSVTNVPEDSTPAPALDTTAPPAPEGLSVSGHRALVWVASSAPDVAKYEVFRFSPDPSRLNAYEMVDVTTASQTRSSLIDVASGATDYYRVRAVDQAGNSSAMSAELAVETSSSPPDPSGSPDQPPAPKKSDY